MGRLTDAARESFDVSKNRVKAPDWLPRVGLVVFVGAIAIIFLLSLGGGSEQAGPITTAPPKVVIPGATTVPDEATGTTVPGSTTTSPASPGTTAPQNGGGTGNEAVVTLANGSGGTTQVPNSAYQLALAKAREAFPTGTLIETRATATESSIEFVVVWDPDGTGPSPRETLVVKTQKTGETWQLEP